MWLNPDAESFEYKPSCLVPQLMFNWANPPLPFQIHPFPVIQIQPPFFHLNYHICSPFSLPTTFTHSNFYQEDVSLISNNSNQLRKSSPAAIANSTPVSIPSRSVDVKLKKQYKQFGCERLHGGFPRQKKCSVWRSRLPPAKDFEFIEHEAEFGGKTTVMIKNIPNKYREMLLELLDKHCREENQDQIKLDSDANLSEYDFLYLPMDFNNYCNLGYAFVNFTTPTAALKLYKSLHRRAWDVLKSKKICEISYARIQGKSALEGHFRNSHFNCDSNEFLPVVFTPPRNGLRLCAPTVIGKRSGNSS